jgi:pimeloyl-ACP methyl ester carboxylesterase
MGIGLIDFYGMWGGGFVGLELALNHAGRVRKLVMSNAFFHEGEELRAVQQNYTPSVAPVWHGGHLMQAWRQMRDQGLFYPWFDRSAEGILRREPFLATDMVHERVCSLLKAGDWYASAYQSHFVYPTMAQLARAPVPTLLASTPWDPNYRHVMDIVANTPTCDYLELDADFTRWGLSFLPWLDKA